MTLWSEFRSETCDFSCSQRQPANFLQAKLMERKKNYCLFRQTIGSRLTDTRTCMACLTRHFYIEVHNSLVYGNHNYGHMHICMCKNFAFALTGGDIYVSCD